MDEFMNKYLKRLFIDSFNSKDLEKFDAFVVGSDQVWRPKYFNNTYNTTINNAFLKFINKENIKRYAYAASFGTAECEYSPKEIVECSKLLKKFDAISSRELAGVKLLKHIFKIEACLVIDPTMLLSKEDYIKIVQSKDIPKSKGELLIYAINFNNDFKILTEIVAQKKGYKPFNINNNEYNNTTQIKPCIETWIQGFIDAKFVITDSFHACVFSILFNKPFIVLGNKETGLSRYETLLSEFNLTDRLIYKIEDYNENITEIDPTKINNKLIELRRNSLLFLEKIK